MKYWRGGEFGKLLFATPGGVATVLLVVLCGVFTIANIDFEAGKSPQRSLEWLLGSGLDLVTLGAEQASRESATKDAWQGSENLEVSEIAQIGKPSPGEEFVATVGGDGEEVVEIAPSFVVREFGAWKDDDRVEIAPSFVVREFGAWKDDDRVEIAPSSDQDGLDASMDLDPERLELETVPTFAEDSDGLISWNYDVCLLVTLGSRSRKGRPALPYAELYRLFNAAKNLNLRRKKLFVGTDFPTIICKMVRDALGPAVECSSFGRFRVKTNQCKHLVVGETKKYIAQPSIVDLRKQNFLWDATEIVDLDVEDPARNPPSLPESQWRPTIVTAFSSNHVEVGLLLLRSLGKAAAQQSEYNVSVVVWTMNDFPSVAQRALICVVGELQSLYKVQAEVRAFDFNAWPTWMRINQKRGYNGGRGEYAWKAVMIHIVLVERGFVYWADAGDRFRSAAGLTLTLRHVQLKGFASRLSSGRVKDWCHMKQLEYFAANEPAITRQPNCDASGIGFTLRSYRTLARPWYECSITRQCIAPDGSSRKNHRQDQSALTVLAALAGEKCQGVDSGIARQMDNRPNSYSVGVDATQCYHDPLDVKWQ